MRFVASAQVILTIVLSLLPALVAAAHVQVPLSLPLPFLESVLREQAFTGPGDSARIGDDAPAASIWCSGSHRSAPVASTSGSARTQKRGWATRLQAAVSC